MKHVPLMLTGTLMLAGCTPELLSRLIPNPTPSPTAGSGDDCTLTVEQPAPMFYVEAPQTASAGATISVTPWVRLEAPVARSDELLSDSFEASVDHAAKTVTLRGSIRRYQANPKGDCAFPAIYMFPTAATYSLEIALPAGSYTVAIASDSYTATHPPAQPHPGLPATQYPGPQATRSLIVE